MQKFDMPAMLNLPRLVFDDITTELNWFTEIRPKFELKTRNDSTVLEIVRMFAQKLSKMLGNTNLCDDYKEDKDVVLFLIRTIGIISTKILFLILKIELNSSMILLNQRT